MDADEYKLHDGWLDGSWSHIDGNLEADPSVSNPTHRLIVDKDDEDDELDVEVNVRLEKL